MVQPEYVRIASSCDFGSKQPEGSLPPPYSRTTSEKDHLPDVMRTIEDTIRGLDHELRQLSLDIHGERKAHRTAPYRPAKVTNMHTFSGHPELSFEERSVSYIFEKLPRQGDNRSGQLTAFYYVINPQIRT